MDGDAVAGQIALGLLEKAGFSAALVAKPADLIPAIRRRRPKMVIADVMLPGVNGLRLCRVVKSDPAMCNIKFVLASQKYYDYEKQLAFRYGASAFIPKPYNTATFAAQLHHILAGTEAELAAMRPDTEINAMTNVQPEPSDLKPGEVRVTFWGARGLSGVLPEGETSFGRQTPCVSVETDSELFIFDGGTGIVALGDKIMKNRGPQDMWLLLSHLHVSHVMGLPSFAPAGDAQTTIRVAGACESEKTFKEAVREIFYGSPVWPARHPKAKLLMYEMMEEGYDLTQNARVSVMYANHPSATLCYSLKVNGKKIVYAPDSEFSDDAAALEGYDEKLAAFCSGADLLIHDAYYTDDDYKLCARRGHSGFAGAMTLARKAGAQRLVLFHINSAYSDEVIQMGLKQSAAAIAKRGWNVQLQSAYDGLTVML